PACAARKRGPPSGPGRSARSEGAAPRDPGVGAAAGSPRAGTAPLAVRSPPAPRRAARAPGGGDPRPARGRGAPSPSALRREWAAPGAQSGPRFPRRRRLRGPSLNAGPRGEDPLRAARTMAACSRAQVLDLYRAMLRESKRFGAYNYRTYAIRRIRDAFRENKNVKDPVEIQALVNTAKRNLGIIRRQVHIGQMYSTDKLVIENQEKPRA
uniref:Complex 1 LYR protein domain-containing protein n=1 Tax=Moschus moschiferus TaxID=68415 RepID=A0A8C6FSA3_MOSMO